jgi:hypothetical protein
MSETDWRSVPDFPNYIVSRDGRLFNTKTKTELRPRYYVVEGRTYGRVRLHYYGVTRDTYIHQLVAQAFIPGFVMGQYLKHHDGNTRNNHVDNLEFKRRELNQGDLSRIKGRAVRIVETGQIFDTVREVASYIGGDYKTVYDVLKGRRHTHKGYTFEWVRSRSS